MTFRGLLVSSWHEETGCSLAAGESPRGSSPASRQGGSERSFAYPGGSRVRGSARHGEPLDGVGGTSRNWGAAGAPSRATSGFAPGSTASGEHGAADRQPVPRPVELALRLVDARGGATVDGAALRPAGFGVD